MNQSGNESDEVLGGLHSQRLERRLFASLRRGKFQGDCHAGARVLHDEFAAMQLDNFLHHGQAKPGDMIDVESCIAQLGGSSIRFYHRMRNAETGADIAGLSQFGVQLDLDARRPSRIADDLRKHAQALLAAN